ncbi:PREDICTED: TP53-target gene 5 protein isoform X2 [Chinchilla lanigera]|uniref:TP53 target 5 n=1 Tax=Chinchilla lanigera TaxID=34839 RepID=A0A8C2UZW7_CHILA|nr:PREDICTED: TP53-target gene 5 protein isoform X2 [Chinchilla lanigera]
MPSLSAGWTERGRVRTVPGPVLLLQSLRTHTPSMCPSAKKKSKNRVVSKTGDENLQDKTKQSVYKAIERNRLKMVLRNLSILKLLKISNIRIQELHNLARRCWNLMLRVPTMLHVSSGEDNVSNTVQPNNELQEAKCLEKNLELKKRKSTGKPKEARPSEWEYEEPGVSNTAPCSRVAVPRTEEQREPDIPRTSRGHGLNRVAQRRQLGGPQVIILKTYNYRTRRKDEKQLDVNGQYTWFEGLPTRIHLPGPKVMCRSSKLRWVKRCCTRFCSATLEMPRYRSYKVV